MVYPNVGGQARPFLVTHLCSIRAYVAIRACSVATTPMNIKALVERIRQGDDDAARQLVIEYESEVRLEIRLRLTDPRLRRITDSADVCQSVFGSFFVRTSLGLLEPEDANHVCAILLTMARRKTTDLLRRHLAQKRSVRRTVPLEHLAAATVGPTVSDQLIWKETLESVRTRLSDEERWLAERRMEGTPWDELARIKQQQPDALRKRLHRAVVRVGRELGLEELLEM